MAYISHHTVRFAEIDAAGVAFFSRVYEWAHWAYERALDDAGIPLGPMLESSEVLMPLVHSEADYFAPNRLGDHLAIHCQVIERSDRKLVWEFRFIGDDGVLRSVVRTVHVAVTRDFKPAKRIPTRWMELLKMPDEETAEG